MKWIQNDDSNIKRPCVDGESGLPIKIILLVKKYGAKI